jgi:hypothetical protein
MRNSVILALACAASLLPQARPAFARDHQAPQGGVIMQMDSVNCGTDAKSDKSLAGEIIGTDNSHQKMHTLLCQEYLLRTDHVDYRIRPRDDKHPVLLPVGSNAQWRIEKDFIKLHLDSGDGKDHEYTVVSMTSRAESPHADAQTADNRK